MCIVWRTSKAQPDIKCATSTPFYRTLSLLQMSAFMEGKEPQSGSGRDPQPNGRVRKAYAIEINALAGSYELPQRRMGALEPATSYPGIEAASGPEDPGCEAS